MTTLPQLQTLVAERFNATRKQLLGRRGSQRLSEARAAAVYIAKQTIPLTGDQLGAGFGGRSVSQMNWYMRAARDQIATNAKFAEIVRELGGTTQ